MKITIACPECSTAFLVAPKEQACRAKCMICGALIVVPSNSQFTGDLMPPTPAPKSGTQPAANFRSVQCSPAPSPQRPAATPLRSAQPKPQNPLDVLAALQPPSPRFQSSWGSSAKPSPPASQDNANIKLLIGAAVAGGVALLLVVVGGIAFFVGRGGQQPVAATPPTVLNNSTPASTTPTIPTPVASSLSFAAPSVQPTAAPVAASPVIGEQLLVVTDRTAQPPADRQAPEAVDVAFKLPELVERIEPAVVRINGSTQDGEVLGSGFVVDTGGLLVTNHHVIAGTRDVKATFANGRTTKVLGYLKVDPSRDLAILRIDTAGLNLSAIPLAKQLPRKGEQVVAFGTPIGLDFTATDGIVSAIREGSELNQFGGGLRAKLIQTSTPISSGNSGGPLVNLKGELVGVNTAVLAVGQNLNFSVAMTEVRYILDKCRPNSVLVAAMPSAPATPKTRTDSGVIIKDEKPEDNLKKPALPSELREWTFSGVKTKARIVEMTSADSDRRNPTKLVEKDFNKRGRYDLPKKIRVVFELESGQKRTHSDSTLDRDNREAVQQYWKDHAYYFIKYRIVRKGGDLVESFAEAGSDRDTVSASINVQNLSLLYILSDVVLPPEQSEEAIGLINGVLDKYMTRTGNRQLKTILNERRQNVMGQMSNENVIAGGSLIGIFKTTLFSG